jgi:proline iminopeptidase
MPMTEGHLRIGDAELWVERQGSGCPVLLSHGGPGLCDNLGGLAAMFGEGFLTIRYDQRGCHRSGRGRSPLTVTVLLDDMDAIRERIGLDKWVVGGHSWGANLSLLYALRHPDRTLALLYVSGPGIRPGSSGSSLGARRARLTAEEWCWLTEALASVPAATVAENQARMWRIARLFWISDFSDRSVAPDFETDPLFAVPRDPEIFEAISADFETFLGPRMEDQMRQCPVPALVLRGMDDPIDESVVRHVTKLLPDSTYVQLPGVGHIPWLERPELLHARLRQFLGTLALGPGQRRRTTAQGRCETPHDGT